MDYTKAWQEEEHAIQLGVAMRANNKMSFVLGFQRGLTARCLNYVLNDAGRRVTSVLDVGCAAGDYYAYLSCLPMFRDLAYEGIDISKPAIEAANKHYKTDAFKLINGVVENLQGSSADLVLSANVVQHQTQPFEHLEQLVKCANKYLVISLRTRDCGETVLDPELSRQKAYGEWVPFILINTAQLYKTVCMSSTKPVVITCFKEYRDLAGGGGRHLPKELFDEQSKMAVTTLIIEKVDEPAESAIVEYHIKSTGISYKKRLLRGMCFKPFAFSMMNVGLDGFVARLLCERIENVSGVLKHTEIITTESPHLNEFLG